MMHYSPPVVIFRFLSELVMQLHTRTALKTLFVAALANAPAALTESAAEQLFNARKNKKKPHHFLFSLL